MTDHGYRIFTIFCAVAVLYLFIQSVVRGPAG